MRGVGRLGDEGRFPVGAVITLLLLAGAGYGAYWLLGSYGYLPGSGESASPTPTAVEAESSDDRPEWLQGAPYELPPTIDPEDEREPSSLRLEPWVWELTDEDWDLQVFREGEGDNYTWLSDIQILFLVSPTEDLFKVSELRTDFDMDVVHWDPDLNVSWIKRGGKSDMEQVIEYDLVSLETTEDWAGSVVSSTNTVSRGVANVEYRGDLADGTELWASYDPSGYATGVFFREGTSWRSSLISDEIRRMALQGLTQDRGVYAWFDLDSGRAVYHGVFIDPNTNRLADEKWVTHDLTTDVIDDDAVVPVPRDDCTPVDGPRAGTFEGDRIVAVCDGDEWLLDPYGTGAAEAR